MFRAWVTSCVVVVGAGCTGLELPASQPVAGVTVANHRWFPLSAGATHEVGALTADGVMACESCHAPAAASFSDITCTGCHMHTDHLAGRLHATVPAYAFESQRCYACHPQGKAAGFDHGGVTGECAECHDERMPFAALPKAGFTHPARGGSDCSACHSITGWAGANGAPPGQASNPAHDQTVTGLVPRYAGTSIAELTPTPQVLHMTMNHQSAQVPAAVASDCVKCHPEAGAGAFFPGLMHSTLADLNLPQPTLCADCHGTVAPDGFVGPQATSPARTPASGEMKHDAVAWTQGAPGAAKLVTVDCGTCHAPPAEATATTWASARGGTPTVRFHSALSAAQKPQPAECLDCHANSRPAAPATLPSGLAFDHGHGDALGECAACHAASNPAFTSWSGGRFHAAAAAAPATCLPCHANERPASVTGWRSSSYTRSPFDYGTNAQGITHGAGEDCAVCHASSVASGSWVGGVFSHAPTTVAAGTCVACHSTQRPDLQPGATAAGMAATLGFDHALNGTGECLGCHGATIAAGRYLDYVNPTTHTLPNGDWKGATTYPGSVLTASSDLFVKLTTLKLVRSSATAPVTGMTTGSATLYNGMRHDSVAIPAALNAGPTGAPDQTKCWHCHTNTNGTVTAFKNGKYHASLTNYAATPTGARVPFAQPTARCADCHVRMLPTVGIVQRAGNSLLSMDHSATFARAVTVNGVTANTIGDLDCSTCHHGPGTSWADGVFHASVPAAAPRDCLTCHYPLMADAAKANVTNGSLYTMVHASAQVKTQACEACHAGALAKATAATPLATAWKPGAYHAGLATQPSTCLECHAVSEPVTLTQSRLSYALPLGGTAGNALQWMSHRAASVAGKDCVSCHAADALAQGAVWSDGTGFHVAGRTVTTCNECHGVAGTSNNLPSGLTNSTTVSTAVASPGTGLPAGTLDQLTHADVNVSSRECGACHTQVGASTAAGVQGREWAQAAFHKNISAAKPLVMNGSTGRCSNCHLNVRPGNAYAAQSHGAFTATAGTADCNTCHALPGTGTATAPNWKGAAGMPPFISVGGFTVPSPPATGAKTQAGIANLPHPTVATGTPCTTCHATAGGGKSATGYDHASSLINSTCNACHEAGSDLLGTPGAGSGGDARPYRVSSNAPNHYYPTDCKECHGKPSGNGKYTGGSAYSNAWTFNHTRSNMTRPTTCNYCH